MINNDLKNYLDTIAKYPLLSEEDEKELSKIILNYQNNKDVISKNDYLKAKEKLINSNLKLVVSIVNDYKYNSKILSKLDLIQEGNIGLLKAIDKYDYTKSRFSTYATFWIKQEVIRAIRNKNNMIRIPIYLYDSINEILKIKKDLSITLNREPNNLELANYSNYTFEKINFLLDLIKDPLSLNSYLDDKKTIEDIIKDDKNPYKNYLNLFIKQKLNEALNTLTDEEKEIISLRYKLNTYENYTLEDLSKKFNCSKEKIRRIEKNILIKLKEVLKDFYDDI